MATNISKLVHSLVLDAGPIIKNEPSVSTLLNQADELYTIPAVIDEIRDPITRARVETTLKPFIKCRSPRSGSIKVITDFARRTGDLEVLSRPDIYLMALAYELECERNHGDWRLRSVPGQKRLNGAPPTATVDEIQEESQEDANVSETHQPSSENTETTPVKTSIPPNAEVLLESEVQSGTVEGQLQQISISPDTSTSAVANTTINETSIQPEETETSKISSDPVEEVENVELDGIDDEDWITPQNLKHHQTKDANRLTEPEEEVKTMQVALITSDFAMQNVLLRMNLNLLSPSLQRIRQLKTWVLRCHACFFITRDMSKQFCNRCGKPTLLRTSCSTDKDGNFKVHLKKNMQWNTRGNIYSIPKPVAGTSNGKLVAGGGKGGWGQGLILAEDQKEYIQAMTGVRGRKEKDLMDEDYLPNILSGDRGRGGGRPKVGAGKNVNSKKRNK